MKIDYLSYSSAKLYLEGCQRLFWERKINNHRTAFDTPFFARGKALHKCLEIYYKNKMNKKDFTFKDFKAIMVMFGIIIKRDVEANYALFDNFVKTRNYEQYEIISSELPFDTFTEDGIRLRGIIDLVYKKGNDIYVVDFKSDIMERDYFIQQIIYSVAIKQLFKADNYYFVLDFLISQPYSYKITDEKYKNFSDIVETLNHGISITEFEDLEYRPGAHCISCPDKVLKTCPFYKQALGYIKEVKSPIKKISDKLLKEREDIMNIAKIIKIRKENIDNFIKQNANKEDFLSTKNNDIKITPTRKYSHDIKSLYQKFGKKILDATSVSSTSLGYVLNKKEMEYVEKNKEAKITGSKIVIKNKNKK